MNIREIVILGPDKRKNSRKEADFRQVYGPSVKIVVITAEQEDVWFIPQPDPLAFLG